MFRIRALVFSSCLSAVLPLSASRAPNGAVWTKYAQRFIDAPTLSFPDVPGAAEYRYLVIGDDHVAVAPAAAKTPEVDLSDVWAKLPTPGFVTVIATACDAQGRCLGEAGRRRFWKKTPYEEGAYPRGVREPMSAARLVYDYVFSLPSTRYLKEKGEPDPSYPLNGYPSKTLGALIRASVNVSKICPARSAEAIDLARKAADYLIARSFPADAPLAFFTRTYERGGELGQFAGAEDVVMMKYPALVGSSFVELAEATGDQRYLSAAERIADTYLRQQGEDGVWPLKVNGATGEIVSANRLLPEDPIDFLERLFAVTGRVEYRQAADRAFSFIENGPLVNWNWEGQFEDIKPNPEPYYNLSKHPAVWTAIYLLRRHPGDSRRIGQARALMRFAEDQFVDWTVPYVARVPGVKGPDGQLRVHAGEYGGWTAPVAVEQYRCYQPIDASVAKMIRGWLALYRATGDGLALSKARTMGETMTRVQKPTGEIPTYWITGLGEGDSRRNNWINCMLASANALVELSEAESNASVELSEAEVDRLCPPLYDWLNCMGSSASALLELDDAIAGRSETSSARESPGAMCMTRAQFPCRRRMAAVR